MGDYIRRIVATTLLVIVISMLLPEGKMGKVIKSFFPLLISLVIIAPIVSTLKFNFEEIFNGQSQEVYYQSTFLEYVQEENIKNLQTDGQDILYENGIQGALIEIEYIDGENLDYEITKIIVDLNNAVIKSDEANIDIIEKVKEIISTYFNIEKRLVQVYGK